MSERLSSGTAADHSRQTSLQVDRYKERCRQKPTTEAAAQRKTVDGAGKAQGSQGSQGCDSQASHCSTGAECEAVDVGGAGYECPPVCTLYTASR